MNTQYRKPLPGTDLQWYDAREAVEAVRADAWATLPYTAREPVLLLPCFLDPDLRAADNGVLYFDE